MIFDRNDELEGMMREPSREELKRFAIVKRGERNVTEELDWRFCDRWNSIDMNQDRFIDDREFIRERTVEPKEDVSFYIGNMMYFKNVAIHIFYDYVKMLNWFIDRTEKHGFMYHFGRAHFIMTIVRFGMLGVLMFIVAMIYKDCH